MAYTDSLNGFKTDSQINQTTVLSWQPLTKAPAIANRLFDTYNHALAYINDTTSSAIPGLTLSVFADPDESKIGSYFVKATAYSAGVANGGVLQMTGKDPQLITEDDINGLFQ